MTTEKQRSDFFDIEDDELECLTRGLIQLVNAMRDDYTRVAEVDAPEYIKAAAANIYNAEVELPSKLHIRLQHERIARGLVQPEPVTPGTGDDWH